MAERRMFAKTIIDSDAFLDMPLSAQALYFHLSMRADDEGFINNPKKIQRMVGSSDDDAKLLIAKKFIIPFDSGVVVIKHWKIHNYIRGDRINQTVYQNEKSMLYLKENGAYSVRDMDTDCIQDVRQLAAECQSDDGQMTVKCQHRLGKVRLDKDSIGKSSVRVGGNNPDDNPIDNPPDTTDHQPPTLEQVIEYVKERGDKIDAEKFFDTYSANGWRTARGLQVRDWRAAVRSWERTEYPDKAKRVNTETEKADSGSFDTDSFFEAALLQTYPEELIKETMK